MLCPELSVLRRVIVNTAAFENLKRVLRTVPEGELRMECWESCAIGYATQDAWFRQRGLQCSFKSASRVFGVHITEALSLFSLRAGTTPDEVIASINRFIGVTQLNPPEAHLRRQAIIDGMLRSALKAERAARQGVKAVLAMIGL